MGIVETYLAVQKRSDKSLNVEQNFTFVKRIAERLAHHLPQSLTVDDLVQEGMMALLEVYKKIDQNNKTSAKSYISFRVRGSMIDLIRKTFVLSKEKKHLLCKGEQFIESYINDHHCKPTESVVAEYLSISKKKYQKILLENQNNKIEDVEAHPVFSDVLLSPDQCLEKSRTTDMLIKAVKSLSKREQMIISLYYLEELNFSEIGRVLLISESRVSLLHSKAMQHLREETKKSPLKYAIEK